MCVFALNFVLPIGLPIGLPVGLPIGVSSFAYLLICGFSAYLKNITLRPSIIKDWIFFAITILVVNSLMYSVLEKIPETQFLKHPSSSEWIRALPATALRNSGLTQRHTGQTLLTIAALGCCALPLTRNAPNKSGVAVHLKGSLEGVRLEWNIFG